MHAPLAFELFAFLIGLLFGSFLNVCISRLPFHESIVKPRSRCPRCLHTIRWYDNIPILSWINLRARCRDCQATIPWRYPLVELLTGIWFAIAALRLQAMVTTSASSTWADQIAFIIGGLILGFLLIGLLVMDWQTNTLPDAFTLTGCAIGVFIVCVQAIFLGPDQDAIHLNPTHNLRLSSPGSLADQGDLFLTGPEHLIFGRIAAIIGAALIPFAIRWLYKLLRGRQGMGLGDIKLMAMIAAFLGFWPAVVAFVLGSFLIFPYAIILLLRKKAAATSELPFGSFLAAGGLITILIGPALLDWYRSFL